MIYPCLRDRLPPHLLRHEPSLPLILFLRFINLLLKEVALDYLYVVILFQIKGLMAFFVIDFV